MPIVEIPVTLSGSIVTAEDASARNAIALTVDIEPVQSGSGDPSPDNVRPISGHTEAVVTRTGVNIWDEEWEVGAINTSGVPYDNDSRIRSKNYIPVKPNTTYYVKSPAQLRVCQYDASGSLVYFSGVTNSSITTTSNTRYLLFCTNVDSYGNIYNSDISFNYPSTDTVYHAYNGTSVTIDLGGTRYGGTLDVINGTLTVDRVGQTYTTVMNAYSTSTASYAGYVANDGLSVADSTKANVIASYLAPKTANYLWTHEENSIAVNNLGLVYIKITGMTSKADYDAYLTANPLQVVYPLATPVTVQLDPETLTLLAGTNNVWADTGNSTLTYFRSVYMALSIMYPAKNGSPKTALSADITASATSMALDDVSVLPAAPNLAVLGEESNAEIVLYNDITGNVVSGMIRGINGTTASVWTAGTSVARNYTSYDHDTIIQNIETLDTEKAPIASPALTGTPTAPTASLATDSTQIATTAFVQDHAPIHLSVTASTGSTATKSDARITSTMRVINIVLGTLSNVSAGISWTTASGSVTFTGTFTGSTTIDFDLVEVN